MSRIFRTSLVLFFVLVFSAGSVLAAPALSILFSGNNYGNYQPCPS